MCCGIFSCFAWAFDFIQRLITFVLTCIMFCFICIGVVAAVAAGVAYGYNYSMAEFLTFARDNTTIYHRGGMRDEIFNEPDKDTIFVRARDDDTSQKGSGDTGNTGPSPLRSRNRNFKTTWIQVMDQTRDKVLPKVTRTQMPEVKEPTTPSWPQDENSLSTSPELETEFSDLSPRPTLPDLETDAFGLNQFEDDLPPGSVRVDLMPTLSDVPPSGFKNQWPTKQTLPPTVLKQNQKPTTQNFLLNSFHLNKRPTMQTLSPSANKLNQRPTLAGLFPGVFHLNPTSTTPYKSYSAFQLTGRPILPNSPAGDTRPSLPESHAGATKYDDTRPTLPQWQPGLALNPSKSPAWPRWPSTIDVKQERLRNEGPIRYLASTKARLEETPFMHYSDDSDDDNEIIYKAV